MATTELVLVDTCLWVPFFNRPQSSEKRAIDALLDDDRVVLVGPILSEVLIGFRRDEQADWVASVLRGLQFAEVVWEEWRAAAQLGRQLMSRGQSLPLSDLVIAAVAQNRDLAIFTSDPHFDLIPNLSRYTLQRGKDLR